MDMYLVKFQSNANIGWATAVGGSSSDYGFPHCEIGQRYAVLCNANLCAGVKTVFDLLFEQFLYGLERWAEHRVRFGTRI